MAKSIHGLSDLQEACLFQEWTEHDYLSCCIDFHDDLMYGLGFMDRVELFGVKKSQFKKANVAEVRKNKIHMKKWMTKYEEDIGDMH